MLVGNLLVLALAAAPASDVVVELELAEALRLVRARGYDEPADVLRGSLRITVRNRSDAPITLWNPGPHGLRFTDAEGNDHLVIHPCQCVKEQRDPDLLSVAASSEVTLRLDEWDCDSPWTPPPPGSYQVSYRLLPAAAFRPAPGDTGQLIEYCRKSPYANASFWGGGWSSEPITVRLKRKKR